ncbi:MAG: hypothetical protein ACRD2T_09205, partial [Thermoanaerobaculia bacterium]
MSLLFQGGRLLRGGRDEPGIEVVVEGRRIAGIGAAAARKARRAGARRVDLDGAYLAPGFVDIHT